jgi:phosphopantetheine adenylyltransferase
VRERVRFYVDNVRMQSSDIQVKERDKLLVDSPESFSGHLLLQTWREMRELCREHAMMNISSLKVILITK